MDNMAIEVVGRVGTMPPTYLSRPRINHTTVLSVFDGPRGRFERARVSQNGECQISFAMRGCMYTDATIRRALNDGGAMCIEKELRDSTRDMYTDNLSGAGMCPDPKNGQSQWSIRFLRALRTKMGVRHIVAVCHHSRSQVSIPTDNIDSHLTLWHRDAETAVITSPLLDDAATRHSVSPGRQFTSSLSSWTVVDKTSLHQSMAAANDLAGLVCCQHDAFIVQEGRGAHFHSSCPSSHW